MNCNLTEAFFIHYSMFVNWDVLNVCPFSTGHQQGVPYDTRLKGLDDDRGTKGLTQDASKSHFKRSTG